MNFQHFAVENNADLEEKIDRYLSAKQASATEFGNGKVSESFMRHGQAMVAAYLELAKDLGLGAGYFEHGATASSIRVEKSRGESMITIPEGVTLKETKGLVPLSGDDYENMRDNAEQALRSASMMKKGMSAPSPFASSRP